MLENLVRRFLYYPEPMDPDFPLPAYIQGAVEVWIDSADGNRIHGLYWAAPENRPTILFFHGNAQCVFEWALISEDFKPLECGLLLLDYPGYGKSSGRPTEESCYACGRAALAWLLESAETPERRIIIFGKSLGGGVAVELAQNRPVLGVVLESTFRSMAAVAHNLIPLIPKNAKFPTEQYDSMAKIKNIHAPILIIHGDRDMLIPPEEGRVLFDLANEPKQLYWVHGAGHNDVAIVAGEEYGHTIRKWLDQIGVKNKK